jgi:hypothetical protein
MIHDKKKISSVHLFLAASLFGLSCNAEVGGSMSVHYEMCHPCIFHKIPIAFLGCYANSFFTVLKTINLKLTSRSENIIKDTAY